MIAGRAVKVLHIMVCKNEWLNRYYNVPISEITNNIRNRRIQIGQTLRTEERMLRTIPYQNNAIIINQVSPMFMSSVKLGGSSVSMAFPFCRYNINTITTSEFNCSSCCMCWMLGFIFYICFQLCRGKGILCENVEHRCPNCGNVIGKYESC